MSSTEGPLLLVVCCVCACVYVCVSLSRCTTNRLGCFLVRAAGQVFTKPVGDIVSNGVCVYVRMFVIAEQLSCVVARVVRRTGKNLPQVSV